HEHGPAAAERLGDVADAAGGQGHDLALRDKDDVAIALEAHGFAAAGIHAGNMVTAAAPRKVHIVDGAAGAVDGYPRASPPPHARCPPQTPAPAFSPLQCWCLAALASPPHGSSWPPGCSARAAGWPSWRRWTPRCC